MVGPFIVISWLTIPRSIVTMDGVFFSTIPVSQINAISALSSSMWSFKYGTNEGDPLSSSPSKKTEILLGNLPVTSLYALHASINVIN